MLSYAEKHKEENRDPGKLDAVSKRTKAKRAGDMVHVVERLPRKSEVLHSNPQHCEKPLVWSGPLNKNEFRREV
jgi:hypothetical protein